MAREIGKRRDEYLRCHEMRKLELLWLGTHGMEFVDDRCWKGSLLGEMANRGAGGGGKKMCFNMLRCFQVHCMRACCFE